MVRDEDYTTVVTDLRAQLDAAVTLLKLKPSRTAAKAIIDRLDAASAELRPMAGADDG